MAHAPGENLTIELISIAQQVCWCLVPSAGFRELAGDPLGRGDALPDVFGDDETNYERTDKIIIDGKLGQSVVPLVASAATDENSVAADCGQGRL
jgi:hypothetical protein